MFYASKVRLIHTPPSHTRPCISTEMKSSRSGLTRDVALPENFDSFFSFPIAKGGYSGVAVYTDSRTVVPLKAEEGLSGKLQPKPPLSAEERVSKSYPSVSDIDAFPDEVGNIPATFDALDAEGRGLVIDFGLFVLINLYCPNETSEARTSFKMNYHLLLEQRVKQLMQEGREVIVVGDINICATPMDHCDGHLPSNASTFWDHPARAWFHKWLGPQGPMVDVVRSYWPERKGLYTCKCRDEDMFAGWLVLTVQHYRLEHKDLCSRIELRHSH